MKTLKTILFGAGLLASALAFNSCESKKVDVQGHVSGVYYNPYYHKDGLFNHRKYVLLEFYVRFDIYPSKDYDKTILVESDDEKKRDLAIHVNRGDPITIRGLDLDKLNSKKKFSVSIKDIEFP